MNLKKYSWLAVLPMVFTACQNDALVENPVQQGIKTLSATMEGGSNSRAQIVIGGSSTQSETFHWNAGDEFTLFESTSENTVSEKTFLIDSQYNDETPTSTADFHLTEGDGLNAGNGFVAYYPSIENDENIVVGEDGSVKFKTTALSLTVTDELDEAAAWKAYFCKNMFMKASGTVASDGNTSLQFEHLCGLIRVTYTNDTDENVSLSSITLDGSWGTSVMLSKTSANVSDFKQTAGNKDELSLSLSGVVVEPYASKDFYLLFIPPYESEEVEAAPLTKIGFKYSGSDAYVYTPATYLEKTFSVTGFSAGCSYWFNVTSTAEGLAWSKEADVDFSGNFAEVSTFSQLKKALSLENIEFVELKNDIELVSPLTVNHSVDLDLYESNLIISDEFELGDGQDAVIDVVGNGTRFGIQSQGGSISSPASDEPLADYLVKLSGDQVNFRIYETNIALGTSIPNAVYLNNDHLNLRSENAIVISADCIIYNESTGERCYSSNIAINGQLNGDVYFKSNDGWLTTDLTIEKATVNGDLIFAGTLDENLDTKEFVRYSSANVTIVEGSEGWDNADCYVEDQRYDVSTFEDLVKALSVPQADDEFTRINITEDIVLETPLVITKPVRLHLGEMCISLASDFNWSVGGEEKEAAIICEDYFYAYNGALEGTVSTTGKYLLKSTATDNSLYLSNVAMNVNGSLNGISIEDTSLHLNDATSITVADKVNGYAVYCESVHATAGLRVNISGTITGNIGYGLGYNNDGSESGYLDFDMGTIVGDLKVTGDYDDYLHVNYGSSATVQGDGWPTVFDRMQKEFADHGSTGCNGELKVTQDVVFELDPTFEYIGFYPEMLSGSGTITFRQTERSETPQRITVSTKDMQGDVDFVFDGNFIKNIEVYTDDIQKVMNWAEGSDQILLHLTDDVVIEKALMSSKLVMSNDETVAVQPGVFELDLNGYNLTSQISGPSIIWKGGVLVLSNQSDTVSSFTTKDVAIQAGAANGGDTNNLIILDVMADITSTDNCCINLTTEDVADAYKNVQVYVDVNATLTAGGEKDTVVYDGTKYTSSNVIIN